MESMCLLYVYSEPDVLPPPKYCDHHGCHGDEREEANRILSEEYFKARARRHKRPRRALA